VKVLDFGLARALEPASNAVASGALATITSPAVTACGVILGTAAYMSPEQACGQSVDRGADVWAFGAVLFEMLTGARAFQGSDPTQTVASVLRSEPDWSRLPPGTPESIRRLAAALSREGSTAAPRGHQGWQTRDRRRTARRTGTAVCHSSGPGVS
jgi:serine/threonine protein kinase